MGRIVGIDYGDRRCGIAVSDPTRTIAFAHAVIPNTGLDGLVRRIVDLCREQDAEQIVVGWPLNMDGTAGGATEKVAAFVGKLAPAVGIAVVRWDERMTTRSAEAALIEGGARRAKRKTVIDKVAAQILLQHYLDATG